MAGALVHELRLGNRTGGDAELKKIEVVDRATGKIFLEPGRVLKNRNSATLGLMSA
jgi:hypothetical protein